MSKKNVVTLIIILIFGLTWGMSSIFYINGFCEDTHLKTNETFTETPTDISRPCAYTMPGSILAFPAWLTARFITPDGIIVYNGPNNDTDNPVLYILSGLIGMLVAGIVWLILYALLLRKTPKAQSNAT
ncbi:hypothetical protein KKF61_03980 [Patescibacteria group bacterium]|nr:hypothetical protein [Patescibacteria group bacterium]MBU0964387.1 hypothetical protein [Patescibacteria group bacterium]